MITTNLAGHCSVDHHNIKVQVHTNRKLNRNVRNCSQIVSKAKIRPPCAEKRPQS